MTQAELAASCSLTQSVIARLEKKKASPQLDTSVKVATALDCDIRVVKAKWYFFACFFEDLVWINCQRQRPRSIWSLDYSSTGLLETSEAMGLWAVGTCWAFVYCWNKIKAERFGASRVARTPHIIRSRKKKAGTPRTTTKRHPKHRWVYWVPPFLCKSYRDSLFQSFFDWNILFCQYSNHFWLL